MIYRTDIQANPNVLYVFGDNLDREGNGGQAKEMRGEPNSFGIATKRSISHNYPDDYFFDHQLDVMGIINDEFNRLEETLREFHETSMGENYHEDLDKMGYIIYPYDAVVIPSEGLGTGLSRLPQNAPNALKYIDERIKDLYNL